MDDIKKPILYNGYEISEGISVNRRIAYEFFTDVYELSNGEILYLFTKITPQDVKNQKVNVFTISVGQDEFLCAKVKQYSKSSLSNLIDSLTEVRGFDAVAGMNELKQILLKDVIGPLKNPEKYKGSIADFSMVVRVALTSKCNTPDLYEIMRLLGKERIIERIEKIK